MLCDAARSGVTAVAPARCCLQSDGDTATAYCRVVGFACCYGCFKKCSLLIPLVPWTVSKQLTMGVKAVVMLMGDDFEHGRLWSAIAMNDHEV